MQTSTIQLKYGKLQLKTLSFDVPESTSIKEVNLILADENRVKISSQQEGDRVTIKLPEPLLVTAGQTLEIEMR